MKDNRLKCYKHVSRRLVDVVVRRIETITTIGLIREEIERDVRMLLETQNKDLEILI